MPQRVSHGQWAQAHSAELAAQESAQKEIIVLRMRLAQLEESLRVVCDLEVDALYVAGEQGGRLYTLNGADRAYRALIEEMAEGALTLTPEGIIMYANRRFAEMLGRPLSQVIGSQIKSHFAPEATKTVAMLLAHDQLPKRGAEADLLTSADRRTPTMLSLNRLTFDDLPDALAMIVTDLTLLRCGDAAAEARRTLLNIVESQLRIEEHSRSVLAALPAQLALAVKAALRGERNHSAMLSNGNAAENLRRTELADALTPRRREVLKLVAQGQTSKEIARHLQISVKTVVTHRTELMKQLNIHDVAGMVRYAIRLGLISP